MSEAIHEIILKCQQGSLTAFRQLMEQFQSYAYALAYRMLCHESDAEDVVQESFIRVWRHIHRFDTNIKFTTWLYQIVTNLCYDQLRSKTGKKEVAIQEQDHPSFTDQHAELSNRETGDIIRRLVEELSPKQRVVFTLRDLQDLSIREVSRIMKISESSVKMNLYHARKAIKLRIESDPELQELIP